MNASPAIDGEFVARLRDGRDHLIARWADLVAAGSRGRITHGEVLRELTPLGDALLDALADGCRSAGDEGFGQVRALLSELSAAKARQGFTPSETALMVFSVKDAVRELVAGTDDTEALLALSRIVDDLGLFTFETYARARDSVISGQAEQLLELSTPVVKLWEGVVAVPLVGTLDSARTQVVMEKLLQTLVDTGSEHAIIDITGVPAVDTQVAQHLLKTIVAARLMGADCIISGIRPQIAHTIVALGIEFGDIVTKASLADALRLTLQQSGFEVRRVVERER